MNRRARRAADARERRSRSTRVPVIVKSPYGDERFEDFTDALVYGAMTFIRDRGEQWSKEMGRSQTDLAFLVVHESAADVMATIRGTGQDPTGMTDLPNAIAVMTDTRETIAHWCKLLEAELIGEQLSERVDRVPVVAVYDDCVGLRWLLRTDAGFVS
jgi:hypothetical protein